MLVNGTTFPKVAVEPRRYRLRFLNACNARILMRFDVGTAVTAPADLPLAIKTNTDLSAGLDALPHSFRSVHPMHFHLVNVQVINRQPFQVSSLGSTQGGANFSGPATPPEPNETGWKETVMMFPGTVTRIIMKFDLTGSMQSLRVFNTLLKHYEILVMLLHGASVSCLFLCVNQIPTLTHHRR